MIYTRQTTGKPLKESNDQKFKENWNKINWGEKKESGRYKIGEILGKEEVQKIVSKILRI